MFGATVKVEDDTKRVVDAADKAAFRNFSHAAGSIRKDAIASIETSPKPSPPGTPPHTRRGLIRKAIRFDADKEGALIGPVASLVGTSAVPEEFGGTYKGHEYPERAFMWPALERAVPRFAGDWRGSIGE